jgi:uncharacterized protein (TIGR03067 family)
VSRPDARIEVELKRLQGTWEIVSDLIDGTPQVQPRGGIRLTIHGDTYMKEAQGTVFEKGTLKVDPTKKPGALDLSPGDGPQKGRLSLCIYELDGDGLRYCCQSTGGLRPESFTTGAGALEIVTLRRTRSKE